MVSTLGSSTPGVDFVSSGFFLSLSTCFQRQRARQALSAQERARARVSPIGARPTATVQVGTTRPGGEGSGCEQGPSFWACSTVALSRISPSPARKSGVGD